MPYDGTLKKRAGILGRILGRTKGQVKGNAEEKNGQGLRRRARTNEPPSSRVLSFIHRTETANNRGSLAERRLAEHPKTLRKEAATTEAVQCLQEDLKSSWA